MANDFDSTVQKQLDAAMPWVGLYIAAASAVCTLATAVDAINSLRRKKLWFPCKYSSLNAASLTLLAVATKLPMDLNTVMFKSQTDSAAKFASVFFVSIIMTNFMPSLASMTEKEVVANLAGLGILVITITGNVGIQIIELRPFLKSGTITVAVRVPSSLVMVSMLAFSFLMLVSLGVTVPTMKRDLNHLYEENHKTILKEEEEGVAVDNQREHMMKYWVMAESCSPQFVMARSVVCVSATLICWLTYIISFVVNGIIKKNNLSAPSQSSYGIYTKLIVYIQSIGMGLGAIVATLRWFAIVKFRCSTTHSYSFGYRFKTEAYWIQTLKDWRNSFAGLHIRPNRCIKYLHRIKWCVLNLCIRIQIFIVLLSKMLVFVSAFIVRLFLFCFNRLVRQKDQTSDTDLNLNCYVLLLEGEAELPQSFVKSMRGDADRVIQMGRTKQPLELLHLLQKSVSFKGVGEFNSSRIPRLLSQDPPDCWTLPVVTLTCIAVALPNTGLKFSLTPSGKRSILIEHLSIAKPPRRSFKSSPKKLKELLWILTEQQQFQLRKTPQIGQ